MSSPAHPVAQAGHHPSLSAPYYNTHHSSPQPQTSYPSHQPQHEAHRFYGPGQGQDHARSHRTYDSPLPLPPTTEAHHPQTHAAYPPAPSPDHPWATKPPTQQTHWTDHSLRPPAGSAPHTVLPPIASAPEEGSKGPMISRLRNKLVGGRYPLSRTWEKASFVEECRSAPASMETLPMTGTGGVGMTRAGEGMGGDVEMGLEGRRREKRGGVSGDGAFSPSGRPVSLYASPAALRAFKPLPPNTMPSTPSPGQPRGLTSA